MKMNGYVVDEGTHKLIVWDEDLLGTDFLEITVTTEGVIIDRYDEKGENVKEARTDLWDDIIDSLY